MLLHGLAPRCGLGVALVVGGVGPCSGSHLGAGGGLVGARASSRFCAVQDTVRLYQRSSSGADVPPDPQYRPRSGVEGTAWTHAP